MTSSQREQQFTAMVLAGNKGIPVVLATVSRIFDHSTLPPVNGVA